MAFPKLKISDDSGNTVGVTDNKLDVNLGTTPTIDIGDVEIKGHTEFRTYPQFAVGTSLVWLSSVSGINSITTNVKEMIIQADFDNTSFVMVGDVDIAANKTDGIRIDAGDTLTLPFSNTTLVYLRSDTADQKINVSLLL